MSSRSVLRFARRYYERRNVCADKPGRPAGSYSLSQQEQAVLMQELLEHPEKTLSEPCRHVEGVRGARLSVSTLHDYFRRNGITRKMLKRIPYQRCEEDRINYRSVVSQFNPAMLVFLDECGFDKRISRRFGYSFRGYRAQTQRWYGNWGPRITAIPVICTQFQEDFTPLFHLIQWQNPLVFWPTEVR
ncbi:uncharacterized protein LOC116300994 [Actinia tenebrosa]|uniref:Uncharacterized protein LOC116300994 n=1 Tax=Actinia tenebrosa TaxID=6105 RepID=A0A6P8IGH5_ACTTE|nr:uncharacterized protein LOC116300994 [Actinia tenebrosa]